MKNVRTEIDPNAPIDQIVYKQGISEKIVQEIRDAQAAMTRTKVSPTRATEIADRKVWSICRVLSDTRTAFYSRTNRD